MFPGNSSTQILLAFISILALLCPLSSGGTHGHGILYDIFPFVRVYRDGTIQRFIGQDFAPASTDPATGVRSKDVKFSPKFNLSTRLYLPPLNATASHKLPLLVYFHGGGFVTESAFSPQYHRHLNALTAKAGVVAVSVNYRLAPEHPLPIAYQDCWLALNWAFSHSWGTGKEPWLRKYADFRRVYFGGDSAGGNLAHNMAIRVGLIKHPGIKIQGMFLNCPFFLGKKTVGNESANALGLGMMRDLWVHAYPNSIMGLDDPLVNPGMNPNLKWIGSKWILVFVAGNDLLRFRGWDYKRQVEISGWNGTIRVVEFVGENHVFNLNQPKSPNAIAMLKMIAAFLRVYS